MGYNTVIARVARDLWRRKQTLSSGFALGLGPFTAINPWPRAITITNTGTEYNICQKQLSVAFERTTKPPNE